MNHAKFALMITVFSFGNLVFADDMKTLKDLVEAIDNLAPNDLSTLSDRVTELEATVEELNRTAFGPRDKTLTKAVLNLAANAIALAKYSKDLRDRNKSPESSLKLGNIVEVLKAEKDDLDAEPFLVPQRRAIKAQLLILYKKFILLAKTLSAAMLN